MMERRYDIFDVLGTPTTMLSDSCTTEAAVTMNPHAIHARGKSAQSRVYFMKIGSHVMDIVAILLVVLAGTASPEEGPITAFPGSHAEQGTSFNYDTWQSSVNAVTHDLWDAHHPGPWNSWFSPDQAECAKNYIITWGPIGIRTLMHDHTWGGLPAFRKQWPACLCDRTGELLFDCFEVIDIVPGSPASGHLSKGDLLLAMDGGLFRTALALHQGSAAWKCQDTRSLEMDAGERLDLAEGRGRISFDVVRPTGKEMPVANEAVKEVRVTEELRGGARQEAELDVPMSGASEITVTLELTRDHNGSCAAELIHPRFEGPAGTLGIAKSRRIAESTGWGHVCEGVDLDGAPITYKGLPAPDSLWFHAVGHLGWSVPAGYNRFRATLVCPSPAANGYRARVLLRTPPATLPKSLMAIHRIESFNIPRIGSYGRGFPDHDDAKSAMVAKMTAGWLAGQQQPDGSWQRTCGYTSNGYDTAWAGLGLLAQADAAFDPQIRKAAEYIAFKCPQDGWAVPNAMMVLFLSEYWLRTKDNRILTALQTQIERITGEMIYADWDSGHGQNPGYRGTGVSVGGSHVTLALAVANLTPVKVRPGLIDKMLDRVQELAPDGFVPYGRDPDTRTFKPNLHDAGTYSGRHAPYLIASLIHGGPKLFTQNCTALYTNGEVGAIDQGHATQTLSMSWALLGAAAIGPETLERQIEPMRWKLTMLRCCDGGFCQNSYRLEYQGGEGLLPAYLRGGAYLVILNSSKHNLAITGAPQWRAKTFPDIPPVCHDDAAALSYYLRNWGVANAMLGSKSPQRLQAGVKRLLAMGKTSATRTELFEFLKTEAPGTAHDIMGLAGIDPLLRQYMAEMVIGADVRIAVEHVSENNSPPQWKADVDVQYPMAGYFKGATPAERESWRSKPPVTMEGGVEIVDDKGAPFLGMTPFRIERDCGDGGWQTRSQSAKIPGGPAAGPLPLTARVHYRMADMEFSYNRAITADGEEPGNGEKGRKLLGDRVVWVTGRLLRDLSGWNAGFTLESGQYVAAATQGNSCMAFRGGKRWIAPEDGGIAAGTTCEFAFTSGWQPWESRIEAIRLKDDYDLPIEQIKAGNVQLDRVKMGDFDRRTGEQVPFPASTDTRITITVDLAAVAHVRGVDLRLKRVDDLRMTIEAEYDGKWNPVFQGRPGDRLSTFPPVTTRRLRISITRWDDKITGVEVDELRVIRADS